MQEKKKKKEELIQQVHKLKDQVHQLKRSESALKTVDEVLRIKEFAIESSINGIGFAELDGRIVYLNDSLLEMLHAKGEDVLGRDTLEFFQDKDKAAWVINEIQTKGSWSGELTARRLDGSNFYVQLIASLVKDNTGKPICMMASFIDVTKQKDAEQALSVSERKYRKLLDAANDAIILVDVETGLILEANKKTEELIGIEADKIVGMHLTGLCCADQAAACSAVLKEILNAVEGITKDTFIQNNRGDVIPVQISSSTIDFNNRKYVLSIFRDITEFKAIEQLLRKDRADLEEVVSERTKQLARTLKELEDAKRLSDIGALAATVAHELRNPLGVIRTAIYNIKKKAKDHSLDKHLENVEKKILESDRIIKNLLTYSRIKMPRYEQISLLSVLDECIANARNKYKNYEVTIKRRANFQRSDLVEADSLHMNELFTNILDNAYQSFTFKKGAIDIVAEYNGKGSKLDITFEDNGCGIDKQDLPKIFEPFFTKKAKGVGLGLTVCNQVVNLHAGKIKVESKKDKGTKVFIEIPAKRGW